MSNIDIFRKQYSDVIESEERLRRVKQEILDAVRGLAVHKIGDRVIWTGQTGIVRGVRVITPGYKQELEVGYIVGKITKSGDMHKVHNIHWDAIPESELSPDVQGILIDE